MLITTVRSDEEVVLTWEDGRRVVLRFRRHRTCVRVAIEGDAPRQPTVVRQPRKSKS